MIKNINFFLIQKFLFIKPSIFSAYSILHLSFYVNYFYYLIYILVIFILKLFAFRII